MNKIYDTYQDLTLGEIPSVIQGLEESVISLSILLRQAKDLLIHVRNNNTSMDGETFANIQTFVNHEGLKPKIGFLVRPNCEGIKSYIVIDELNDIRAAMNGGFFTLILENEYCTVYCDEDGEAKKLPMNWDANLILNALPNGRAISKPLLGPVLFVLKN